VLVTPNNPTGAIYPPQTLQAFARLCAEKGLWLILDETYRDFLPAGIDRPHDLFADAGWRERVVQLYSFSKAYAVPGHRLGAIVAGPGLMREIGKVLDSLQICAPRTGQRALVWGIPALRDWREENRVEINARAAAFARVMGQIEGWRVDSVGAYFAYVRHPFAGVAGARVAERLARERGVLALPGSYFGPGQQTHLRVAFANVGIGMVENLRARLSDFEA
jgi:aspartate/methionine/tyrosine aminotransferase